MVAAHHPEADHGAAQWRSVGRHGPGRVPAMSEPRAPRLVLSASATVGRDVVFGAGVVVHDDVVIGDGVLVQDGAVLGKTAVALGALERAVRGRRAAGHRVRRADPRAGDRLRRGADRRARDHRRPGLRARARGSEPTASWVAAACVDNDVTIGERVRIQTDVYVTAYSVVEDDVFIGPRAMTTNDQTMARPGDDLRGPTLRRACRVGGGAVLLPGVEIGEDAFVAPPVRLILSEAKSRLRRRLLHLLPIPDGDNAVTARTFGMRNAN